MYSHSDGITGFLVKNVVFFEKSVVLILHYQLPFLQSGRFPGNMNWTGLHLDLASLSSVLEAINPSQNLSTDRHRVL